jgi:molybdopterin molybdotransferase
MIDPHPSDRFLRRAIRPDEALRRILAHVRPLEAETADLANAWNRRLAAPIRVPHPFPPFRRSAMDGYAVRAEDLPKEGSEPPAILEVLEHLPAGTVPCRLIAAGQASRIMTGGMLPEGADTVVMLEMTEHMESDGREYVRIGKTVPRGRNVAEAGSELREGTMLYGPGRRIGAGETAVLASCGYSAVPVVRRPRVGILSTGSELVSADRPLAPGQIRNSNAPMLASLVREAGGIPLEYAPLPDDANAVEEVIRRGLAECDLLLTTGGVSVGDLDILVDILARWEGITLFNKISMRPGSPTTAAVLDGKLLLALSGNPGASFVAFHLFARPTLLRMQRLEQEPWAGFEARLSEPYAKVDAYTRYIRSRVEIRSGALWVRPTGADQSSLMTPLSDADSLMVIPPLKQPLDAGAFVTVLPLGEGGIGRL